MGIPTRGQTYNKSKLVTKLFAPCLQKQNVTRWKTVVSESIKWVPLEQQSVHTITTSVS